MMNNETYLDFCFVRSRKGHFTSEIDGLLQQLFRGVDVNWYLEEKKQEDIEIVVAEVKGMSAWRSEEETLEFLDAAASDSFWEYLKGYQMYIYPAKGCGSCGNH